MTRHQKEQPDLRIGDEIVEAIDPVIARPIGHEQSVRILHRDETRCVPARGGIGPTMGVRSRQYEERRAGNEGAGMRIDMVEVLLLRQKSRLAIDGRQLGFGFDLTHLFFPIGANAGVETGSRN